MWFKLGLEADDHPNMHLPPGLTVVDVVRDYLSALYQHAMDTLYRKFHRGVSCLSGGRGGRGGTVNPFSEYD